MTIFPILADPERLTIDSMPAWPFKSASIALRTLRGMSGMDGQFAYFREKTGLRKPGSGSSGPSGVWSQFCAVIAAGYAANPAPALYVSDRCVGDRPSSGKETGLASVAHI